MNNFIHIYLTLFFLLTGFFNNSFATDTLKNNGFSDTISNNKIEYNIIRKCEDSIIQDIKNKKIYLYGNASVDYGEINITANLIVLNWNNNTIHAVGTLDSNNNITGNPIFSDGNEEFKATEITYNIKSKKCIIKKIITQEGDGYIHGEIVKKDESNIFYLKKGEYTTCNHEKPHFSIKSNKIKIEPNKQIVTGPAYMTLFNIPTPLFLPFGYFPTNENESSGIIIPSYGENINLGFFLKDGGYYLALNDYLDLSIKADVYSKGSWTTKGILRYKNRYKYNGSFNLNYGNIVTSEIGFPNYRLQRDFFVKWNHRQDPKASPSISFSSNVNAGSSSFYRNNTSSNTNEYLSNTFNSSISFSKRWEGSPFNLSTNLNHNQNTQSRVVNLILPDISFSMNKIYPFRNLIKRSKNDILSNIGIRYNLNSKNQFSAIDSLLFKKKTLNSIRTGVRHSIPINLSFKLLKHITTTQSINITERWYINQIEKNWNGSEIMTDTINKFTRGSEYSFSSTFNTKVYGIAQFNKGKIAAFRHVISPSLSFTYNPSTHNSNFDIYKDVQKDSIGNIQTYSIMENGIYGSPRKNRSGNISMTLGNIFGLKIRKLNDTIEEITKIKLIESFNISSSYNIFADSFNFSKINMNIRTKLLNKINLNYTCSYDPYIIDSNGRRAKYEIFENNRIARFNNSNLSIGISINDKSIFRKDNEDKSENENRDFYKIPWNLNINFTQSKNSPYSLDSEKTSTSSVGFSGNIKITPKWKIGFNSGYDFTNKDFSYTKIDIYRDLHCWEMLFNWIPTGYQKSYTVTIRVKAQSLKDLKIERRKDWINPN